MDDIRRVIDAAGRRLFLNDWAGRFVVVLTVALGAMVLARIAQKLIPFELPWVWVGAGALGAAALVSLVWSVIAKRADDEVARHVDERAGLRESLSTALVVAKSDDGWSRNVVQSAGERAKRVVVRDAVPIAAPRLWAVPAALGLALLAVWWVPTYDLTGLFEKQAEQQQAERELEEVRLEVKENEQRLNELLQRAGVEVEEGEGDEGDDAPALDPEEPVRAEEVRRQAIKRLTSLADQLEERLDESEQSQALEAINNAMRRMKTPGEGPASEMAKQMARGNYTEAKAALEELAQQMASGEMSESDRERAAEQLQDMASQLEQLANQQQQLEEQLRQAGYSQDQAQQLAQNPEQLEQEMQNNESLSEEQKQQMQQSAQAQQQASDAMSSAAQAMGQMAQAMQQPNSQQAMDGMESMSGQLSQMEMMQSEMQSAQAAMSEVQQQLQQMGHGQCDNPGGAPGMGQSLADGQQGQSGDWQPGQANQLGMGSGGPGRGNGMGPEGQPVDFIVRKERANVDTGEGPIIASMLVQGSQVRGESRATFSTVVGSAQAQAAEALEQSRVPRRYESAVQGYFGRLERAGEDPAPEGN